MNRFSLREWGWYLTLLDRAHYKVKLLRFKNGRQCSMQRHFKRNELWLFLRGGGWFHNDISAYNTKRGDYRLVSKSSWHQFTAWSNTLVLEIQYGEKCEEGDIVRV